LAAGGDGDLVAGDVLAVGEVVDRPHPGQGGVATLLAVVPADLAATTRDERGAAQNNNVPFCVEAIGGVPVLIAHVTARSLACLTAACF